MRQGAHTLWDCHYHLVWCPKYRKHLFSDVELHDYTWELFKKIGEEYDVVIEAMEIAEDHVHMMVEIPPKRSVAEVVRMFKSISGREIFEKFPGLKRRLWGGELWKDGYFVRSVGSDVTGAMVRRYIEVHKIKERRPAQLRLDLKDQPKRA
jgi:putative transposase